MALRWTLKPDPQEETVDLLRRELGVTRTIALLLAQRGISTFNEAKEFFRPDVFELHDPFLMKDMDKAIDRIELAVANQERIMVYGDYDVDGTTAVSLVYSFLSRYVKEIDYYIPDRYKEGYGISKTGLDFAADNGFTLIIALDCGIKSLEQVAYAKQRGVDFIICDHHRPGSELPDAIAVLDPKREDCSYPYKELCGCGVGFKLVQAFCKRQAVPFAEIEEYLDLCAISIAADIVPITGENRILAYFGIKRLNESPRLGLKYLIEQVQLKRELTISDVVFTIGPRINAAGRIYHGKRAVELLISDDTSIAEQVGKAINENNLERKDLDKATTDEALKMLQADGLYLTRKSTVLFNESWHKGVIGIVASRMTEVHYRPTILLTSSNGVATGSARSVKGFDVYNAIEACSDLLEQFGGHKYAAGLTMPLHNIPIFIERFEKVVSETITEQMLIPEIEIDAEIDLSEITDRFYRILKQFGPFGPDNMRPVFITRNAMNAGYSKAVGETGAHLKLDITQKGNTFDRFSGIGFNLGVHADRIIKGDLFDVVYTLDENEWNGKTSIQLKVEDIRFQ